MEASNFVMKTEEFFSIIWEALKAGENDAVMALLEGVDVKAVVDSSKKTLLHLSALYGNIFITNHLINHGCTIDAEDDSEITPLMLAIYYRQLEVTQILIDAGADLCRVNSHGRSPVFYAKLERNTKIDEIMRSAIDDKKVERCKVNKLYMETTLFKANTGGIQDLYSKGQMDYSLRFSKSEYKGINSCSSGGLPLIRAVFYREVLQLKMNLNYQVSPNVQDENGWTALHAVATIRMKHLSESFGRISSWKILDMLFDHGANVHAKDNKGATPLHMAASFDEPEVCRYFLQKGADVNARDNKGRTPLHAALATLKTVLEHNETVEVLLENGADVFAMSSKGKGELELKKKFTEASRRKSILENLAMMIVMEEKPMSERRLRKKSIKSDYHPYELELRLAKEDRIIDNVTFFDFLTKSPRTLGILVKNENFRRIFKTFELRVKYPNFAEHIQRRFDEAVKIIDMTNDAAVILSAVLPCFRPDNLALEHILSYLTYEDLQTLTN